MAYKLTYQFGSFLNVGERLAGENYFLLSITFNVNDYGTDVIRFARDYNMHLLKLGTLDYQRDLTENFMVVGQYDFEIYDGDEELWKLLFEGTNINKVDKDAEVKIDIKYYNETNYKTEFIGNIDATNITYDKTNNVINLIALPRTDKLKSVYLYNENADGKNYGINPLNLDYTNVNDEIFATEIKVKDLIHKIFQIINPNCDLIWKHNWLFEGVNLYASPQTYSNFKLQDIYFSSTYLSSLFFANDNIRGVENVYQLLMNYALTFGFICGLLDNNTAFVKDAYYYNAGNLQNVNVYNWKVTNKLSDIETVRITTRRYDRDKKSGKNYYKEIESNVAIIPYNSQVRGDNIIDEELQVHSYYDILTNVYLDFDMNAKYLSQQYEIRAAKPNGILTYQNIGNSVCNYYYNLRNRNKLFDNQTLTTTIGRIDEFEMHGINYNYFQDFNYADNGYQIISLKKNFDNNTTSIEAMLVANDVEANTPYEDEAPPKPFYNVLPGGYLRDYAYNSEITKDDVNNLSADLFLIPAGFHLKKIIIKINQKFDTLLTMKIVDNDGVLIDNDRIPNENNEVLESFIYKDYTTQQQIKAVMTKYDYPCTTGDADITFEIRTRL